MTTEENVMLQSGEVVRVEKETTEWETFVVVRFEEGEQRINAEVFPEDIQPGDKVRIGRTHRGGWIIET